MAHYLNVKRVHCGRDGWNGFRERKKRRISPTSTLEPSKGDIILQNSMADMIQQSHSVLL